MADKLLTLPIREREVWCMQHCAAMLGLSRTTIRKMNDDEQLPAPVYLFNKRVWRAAEIRAWLAAGCPQRSLWRWSATQLPTLTHALEQRKREYAQLQDEFTILQQDFEALDQKHKELARLVTLMNNRALKTP